MSIDIWNDPRIKAAFADHDTRLLMAAAVCGLVIRDGHKPRQQAIDYMLHEYKQDEIKTALEMFETIGKSEPRIAETSTHAAEFVRKYLLQGATV